MKKITSTILAVIYLITTTGAVIHIHYCMGKVTKWNFEVVSKEGCGNNCTASLKNKKNCCDDRQIQFKIDKDQQPSYQDISFIQHEATSVITFTYISGILPVSISFLHPSVHAPPPISSTPVYISNCNFRI